MAEQRLPIVDGDDGQWGEILNQYLEKEHYNTGVDNAANGGHQTVTIRAGQGGTNPAPLTFTSGTLVSSANTVAGALEFYSGKFYVTSTNATAQKAIATYADDGNGATGDVYYRDSSGNFVRLAVGSPGTVLTVSGSNLPSWSSSGSGLSQQQAMAISSLRM